MLLGTKVSPGRGKVSEPPSTRCSRGGKGKAKAATGAAIGKVAPLAGKEVVAPAGKEAVTILMAAETRLVLVQRQAEVLLPAAYLHGHSPTVLRVPAAVAADRRTRKKSTATPTSTLTQLLIRNTVIKR